MPIRRLLRRRASYKTPEQKQIAKSQRYIHDYWAKLIRTHPEDSGTLIGLPHSYIVPAADPKASFQFEEQYYWDSYFTALGLTDPSYQPLVEGMLENLLYLLRRFGIIPNASRMYFTSRSQPPLLSSFIFLVYDRYGKDSSWLQERIGFAEAEYQQVWMSQRHPQWHNVHKGLSRYYDINVLHDLAEAESGWDMTPRFERKCLDYLPVDLNAFLYKYETDFARAATLRGDDKQASAWQKAASARRDAMNSTMWASLRGFYFDYNYQKGALSDVWSLAAFVPMWAGLVDGQQAKKLVAHLDKFEKSGGLTTTSRPFIDMSMFGSLKTQWAYPNGWAPLHYFVIEGLKNYGYQIDAERIAKKWLHTNAQWFDRHGVFLEKYNVVNSAKHPVEGVYPSQTGFGWTNAVFSYYAEAYYGSDAAD